MIEPSDDRFERVDRLLGRVVIAVAAVAACLLVALVVMLW